jgi:hypothetical protein
MSKTIDLFNPARTPYLDNDMFAIAYPGIQSGQTIPPPNIPTYRGNLADLVSYLQVKLGTGQVTFPGDNDYNMGPNDFELAATVALTATRTWNLCNASIAPRGQRRRIVDLVGAIGPSSLVVNPISGNTINGVNAPITLNIKYSSIIFESDGSSRWTIVSQDPVLIASKNLSDVGNITTARTNLGLGSSATHDITDFMIAANNLSELTNKPAARTNLGLGTIALLNAIAYGNLDPSMIASTADVVAGTPGKLVPASALAGSGTNPNTPVNLPFTAGTTTIDFSSFKNGTFTFFPGIPAGPFTVVPSNATAGQSGFITFKNGSVSGVASITWGAGFTFASGANPTVSARGNTDLFQYYIEGPSLIRGQYTKNYT